jgi:hypothetical protein
MFFWSLHFTTIVYHIVILYFLIGLSQLFSPKLQTYARARSAWRYSDPSRTQPSRVISSCLVFLWTGSSVWQKSVAKMVLEVLVG